ncbi:hypothetical protein GH714_024869 [Hevea brasiliensis]|uniref:BTB domain-containing protein n=1 Tax=Hevea brasiliensis TaxID=3981 RepID=A0A6A6NIW3_HEVBR|nr:hypothetical protein GH714_024869 [Hevea brasiliensis]
MRFMQVHIVQRGAVRPLIDMLDSPDAQLKEMSTFALGRLAQSLHHLWKEISASFSPPHLLLHLSTLLYFLFFFEGQKCLIEKKIPDGDTHQAGIAHNGGIMPLLKLLESKNGSLQHNAAFALYGLADNEDNVAELVKVGGVQKLQDGEFIVQATKDCVEKTLKRLEEKIHGRVLKLLLYLMRVAEKSVQRQIALALAHLCASDDRKAIFLDNHGLELLLGLLESGNQRQQHAGAVALYKLATKTTSISLLDAAPLSPTPQVYLGEQYVNNSTLADVTFLVEGKRFYAHRICLLASSDAFRAMFDGGYRERDAKDVEIPNIRWDVFELMMRFIYTGSVDVDIEIAQDLLKAADQYLLEGLKRLCECTIAQDISVENVSLMYELSEGFNARSLMEACILFIFEQFDKMSSKPWCSDLIQNILPELARPSQAVSCPMELTSVNLYRPQWDRGRHGFLNFTLDKKGVDLRTSVVCHAAGMPLASNMMNLGKGILEDVCVRKWVSVLANWWPTWCLSVCVGRVQKMVCGLLCARECDQVAQGSDANARKRGRLRDWVAENVMVPKFPTPILGSWQGRHKLSLALCS